MITFLFEALKDFGSVDFKLQRPLVKWRQEKILLFTKAGFASESIYWLPLSRKFGRVDCPT